MKEFVYNWDNDIFLLHIQVDRNDMSEYNVIVAREYEGGKVRVETINVKGEYSHRFIVSRTHPKERNFKVTYPIDSTLEAFKIDDRAYYPTQSFFVG